jgi:hypothetical protein
MVYDLKRRHGSGRKNMGTLSKGKSPFYPGQPVPVELFVGRVAQINRIMDRGVVQVAAGKPTAIYIQGEYGIGKSSIAGFVQKIAEKNFGLHAIYAPLGGASTLEDVGASILEATVRSGIFDPKRSEKFKDWVAKYIGEQKLFGVTIHADALAKDAPTITRGILPFLNEVLERIDDTSVKGIFLVLDEINGIAGNRHFAHFIKGIVDENAIARKPVPLLLMLCGVEERRRDMIRNHQPIDRIFDVIDIELLSGDEMKEFFTKAFSSVSMEINPKAMNTLTHFSAGYPKIMHLVGDEAYWTDKDGVVDEQDASHAVLEAAEEVGKKYVDQQVYKALRSQDYQSIFNKIALMGPNEMTFKKADVATGLTETEKRKFNNFLQRMKKLKVLRAGDVRGEYVFNLRMVRLYIWLRSIAEKNKSPQSTE